MSPSVKIPTRLPAGSVSVGQLITNPLHDGLTSFGPSDTTLFDTIRTNPSAQRYLLESTLQNRKVYFVADLQTSKHPFSISATQVNATTSAQAEPFTRPDSAVDLDVDIKADGTTSTIELLPVRCRVGFSTEPHTVDDVEYSWTYHRLNDEGLQLSIGLGKAVETLEDKRAEREDNGSDMDWSYGSDEEEGLGGF